MVANGFTCPYGDIHCIPGDRAWQCYRCEDDVRRVEPNTVTRLFVYGTLLSGCSNYKALPEAARRCGARVRGKLHYASHTSSFPVLVPNEDEWTLGELVYLDYDDPKVQDVFSMELTVGYDVRQTLAHTWRPLGEGPHQAVVFSWPWKEYGLPVKNNDWARRYNPRKEMPWESSPN